MRTNLRHRRICSCAGSPRCSMGSSLGAACRFAGLAERRSEDAFAPVGSTASTRRLRRRATELSNEGRWMCRRARLRRRAVAQPPLRGRSCGGCFCRAEVRWTCTGPARAGRSSAAASRLHRSTILTQPDDAESRHPRGNPCADASGPCAAASHQTSASRARRQAEILRLPHEDGPAEAPDRDAARNEAGAPASSGSAGATTYPARR